LRKIIEIDKITQVMDLVAERPELQAVFFDIDNTLTASHSQEVAQDVVDLLAALCNRRIKMALISNNSKERVEKFAQSVGIPFYWLARKPLPFALHRAARDLGVTPSRCIFVGDQIITDIFAASLAGMEAVLVYPYSRASDSKWQNIFSRRIERHFFRRKI
jgi:hypothetical protein